MSDSSEDDYMNIVSKTLLLYHYKKKYIRRKSRFWINNHIRGRPAKGDLLRMYNDLQDDYFKNYFRMDRQQFQEILSLIEEDIKKTRY